MNFDGTKQSAAVIETDKHSGGGTSTGFSMQQSNTTHHLSSPEGLVWQIRPESVD